jgi:hypothetical protein
MKKTFLAHFVFLGHDEAKGESAVAVEKSAQGDFRNEDRQASFLMRLQHAADESTAPIMPPDLRDVVREFFRLLAGGSLAPGSR